MIKIAIVDDEATERAQLQQFFEKLAPAISDELEITTFQSGEAFLWALEDTAWDMVCLDIQMGGKNGVDIAHEIRKIDKRLVLIFVTNLAHLAIEGYAVKAYDFILKPVNYDSFALKVRSALNAIVSKKNRILTIADAHGWKKISTSQLQYVEVSGHYISYHTTEGIYRQKASLKELEQKLEGTLFKRCNNCYLVNLQYVSAVEKDDVLVGMDRLKMSRPRKQEFMQALTNYMGGQNV